MFSGIIENCVKVKDCYNRSDDVLVLICEKPNNFNDLNIGDSISVNGVCLTLETTAENSLQFALAPETLSITGWNKDLLMCQRLNLERSLKLGDRIHGHFVTGHVDSMGEIVDVVDKNESRIIEVQISSHLLPYVWGKGSLTINGVSLTINSLNDLVLSFCLVPETLKKTNLGDLQVSSHVTIESDYLARAYYHWFQINQIPQFNQVISRRGPSRMTIKRESLDV